MHKSERYLCPNTSSSGRKGKKSISSKKTTTMITSFLTYYLRTFFECLPYSLPFFRV